MIPEPRVRIGDEHFGIAVLNSDLEALMTQALRDIDRQAAHWNGILKQFDDDLLTDVHPQPQKVVDQAVRELKQLAHWRKVALAIADVVE